MKIITFNLNGIRSAISKGLYEWVETQSPDVLCVQETKAQPDQIDVLKFKEMGYNSYVFSAEKKGYSGKIAQVRLMQCSPACSYCF